MDLPELVEEGTAKIAPIVSSRKAAALILKSWDKKYGRVPDFIVAEGPNAGGHLGFSKDQLADVDVQTYFENDIRFTCREIGGVNFVGIDNGNYQISSVQFEKLKNVVAEGKPILLFMHIPLYSRELQARHYDCYLAPPEDVLTTYGPWQVYEQKADEQTLEACQYIRSQELIKYVICGHLHLNHETQTPGEIKQIVTGLDTLREITVV